MSNNAPEESRAALLITVPPDPATQGNVLFEVVRELSEPEYERFKTAYRILDGILVENLFTYYSEAFKSFMRMWKDSCAQFANGPIKLDGYSDDMLSLGIRLRGAVLSVVSMLCYHQERTLEEVKAKFTRESSSFRAARAIFDALYDDYFGYRYLYKLRNVMIHETIAAVGISAEAHANDGNPFAFIDLTMDRSTLCDSDKINATLKAELATKPGDPSIIQMTLEIYRAMQTANRQLLAFIHPDLTEVCNTILEFDELFEGRDGVRGLINQKSPELRAPFTTGFTPWAGDVIMFARSYTTDDWSNPDDEE
jgi:hypothetical protein